MSPGAGILHLSGQPVPIPHHPHRKRPFYPYTLISLYHRVIWVRKDLKGLIQPSYNKQRHLQLESQLQSITHLTCLTSKIKPYFCNKHNYTVELTAPGHCGGQRIKQVRGKSRKIPGGSVLPQSLETAVSMRLLIHKFPKTLSAGSRTMLIPTLLVQACTVETVWHLRRIFLEAAWLLLC